MKDILNHLHLKQASGGWLEIVFLKTAAFVWVCSPQKNGYLKLTNTCKKKEKNFNKQ